MDIVFKPKPKPKNTIKVEFPSGESKTFEILGRNIESQRKVVDMIKSFSKIKPDDADGSYKALEKAVSVLLCGATLDDLKELDTEDIVDLINTIKESILSVEARTEPEKKTVSNEPT